MEVWCEDVVQTVVGEGECRLDGGKREVIGARGSLGEERMEFVWAIMGVVKMKTCVVLIKTGTHDLIRYLPQLGTSVYFTRGPIHHDIECSQTCTQS